MRGKPNPILHMLLWGFGSGTLLAVLFIVFFLSMGMLSFIDTLLMFIQPLVWFYALMLGGIPGVGLGLLTGLLLWALSRGFQLPFNRAEMQKHRAKVYALIGTLTTIGGFVLTTIFFWDTLFTYGWGIPVSGSAPFPLVFFLPPFIAGIAASYAAHRYMFRLRLWSEQQYGVQKEKAKNFEHLEDKIEETNYDDGKEEEIQKLS